MIGARRASSESRKASVSAGVLHHAVVARSAYFAFRSLLSSAFLDSSDRRSITLAGSFAGPVRVVHEIMSMPGSVSAVAGTSGATDVRLVEVTPSGRTLPARDWVKVPGMLSNIMWI